MRCAWEEVLNVLPFRFRSNVDRLGKQQLQELRLRINAPPELVLRNNVLWLEENVTKEDILFCVNAASNYSPWAASTIKQGYLTVQGGHRIGLCGEAVIQDGAVTALREIHSINIRIARDFSGIAVDNPKKLGSTLCIGPPGAGKTTLLRDLARKISMTDTVCVVDERGELFPLGFQRGKRMDVLTGCPKSSGIDIILRSMGPTYIAMDEITAPEDASAMLHAAGCGVQLLATAHAGTLADLRQRPIYRTLMDNRIFQTILVLHKDQRYRVERVVP